MSNAEVAAVLDQMADLLDFKGESPFRINSYRRAARAIRDLGEHLTAVAGRGELREIPGVGETISKKIGEYLETGRMAAHQELLAQFPPGLPDLLQIPGLGPRKVALLHRELGICGTADLEAAIADGRLAKLPRFGARSAEKLLEGIRFVARSSERTLLPEGWAVASVLRDRVAQVPGVERVEVAGSLRRGCETVGDLDLVCAAADGRSVIEAFTQAPQVASIRAAGDTKGSITVARPTGGEVQADLRVVPPESFGAALQYFTGSKEHNVRLRELAIRRGWRLNEYGLFEGESRIAGTTEEDIYAALGLPWIPPELREDRGEIQAGAELPQLVTLEAMRSDLHLHTTASDGKCVLEELAVAARERGYEYIAVTDHSKSSVIANGLSVDRLLGQVEEIRNLNQRLEGISILAGTECDILSNGRLDYPDELLAQLDWVVASIHLGQQQKRPQVTQRTIAALENPYVCVVAHPTGRIIGRRDAMDLDMEEVIAAAARTGTALEVNSSCHRLDLSDVHVRMAMDAGCWIAINTDAHSIPELASMGLGVHAARRGWALRERVLNTFRLEKLKAWVAGKRSGPDPVTGKVV